MKKGIIFFLVFAGIITALLYYFQDINYTTTESGEKVIQNIQKEKEVNLNRFIELYKKGTFEKIELKDDIKLQGYEVMDKGTGTSGLLSTDQIKRIDYNLYISNKPLETSLKDLGLSFTGATPIEVTRTEQSTLGKIFLEQILPILFLLLVIIFVFRLMAPKGGGFPFGAQAGKLANKAEVKTTFEDVAGMEEVKDELKEIVDYLKNPKKYLKVGAKIPRGLLLFGPPGSGKTLLARAVAGQADVPFFSSSGSEFMEMLVGMGAAKVRDLFKKAKAAAPAIVFIDEIDTIGKKRGVGYTGGHQEQEQTLNQILTEMDGFQQDSKVIVIAATNRPDTLDSALLRPGRFDRKIYVGRPTLEERLEILKIHCANKKLNKDVNLESIARRTSGFVGADLENIANEAALRAARQNRYIINNADIEYALEKIIMGPEKKIKSIKEKEKETIAYHELGHAVTAYHLPNADPVEKISIVSRGMALGVTWLMPTEDTYLQSKAKFLDEMVTLVGGRACEEVFFGKDNITTGASNDFEKATKIASDMILKYGMDEELGPILYFDEDKSQRMAFKPYSEKTAEIIDQKIKSLIKTAYQKALDIIKKNKSTIKNLAKILLEKEYLTKEEFMEVMKDPAKTEEIMKKFEKIKKQMEKSAKEATKKSTKKKEEKKSKNKTDLEDLLDKYLKK